MSNLWFFRLKRAEQQRRRSSGESLGSTSVQSAAGVSASSLPLSASVLLDTADINANEEGEEKEEEEEDGRGSGSSRRESYSRNNYNNVNQNSRALLERQQQQHCLHSYESQNRRNNQTSITHLTAISRRDTSGASANTNSNNSGGPTLEQRPQSPSNHRHLVNGAQLDSPSADGGGCVVAAQQQQQQRCASNVSVMQHINKEQRKQRQFRKQSHLISGGQNSFNAHENDFDDNSLNQERHDKASEQQQQSSFSSSSSPAEAAAAAAVLASKQKPITSRFKQQEFRNKTNNNNNIERPLMSLDMAGDNQFVQQRPSVPQVTIIRSDSTSSFIPLDCDNNYNEPDNHNNSFNEKQDNLDSSNQQQRQYNFVPIVSKLNEKDGSVESSCYYNDNLSSQQQQQQAVSSNNIDNNKKQDKRGRIHDQLISGKVPPIQESLLSPGGGGRLSVADSMDNLAALIPRVRVEFYNSENTLKEQLQMYFIKDHTVSLYIRTAKFILKVLACYLYVCRVILDRGPAHAACYGCATKAQNLTVPTTISNFVDSQGPSSKFESHPYDGPINFRALFWVDRGQIVWTMQTTIAVICFIEALLMQYLTYKNSIISIISFHFLLEIITNIPFIISIFWIELRTLFVAGFLNCWLAKQCLEAMLNDLSIARQSSVFSHRLTILSATVFCLIFTSACGFQHTQRSGGRSYITIFESIYFVVVTFSTVGYGDFKPETWPSQLFIMVMICVALIVLPTQFEQLAYFWFERKKLGASYAHHSTSHEKHVVVCSTTLRADTVMDFLNEFYAHPLLQTFSVVLLSPCELDTTMKLVLQTPTWNNRVVYIQGSALKASDLIRARMQSAEACFILAARNYNDRSAADEHTILRSWAIRDFSPYVPQYVQIFRTENKIHVAFAEHVVCDDEFKYALLANNCLIPGTSTLVTLLLHTSQQQTRRRRRKTCFKLLGIYHSSASRTRQQQRQARPGLPTFVGLSSGRKFSIPFVDSSGSAAAPAAAGEQQQNVSTDNNNNNQQISSSDEENDDDPDGFGGMGGSEWKKLYGKCSANEIYHIRLSDSRFFGEYQGKSFTYASFHSHRKFGVALIGVQTDMRGTWPIMLNPGPSYVLKSGDILFYINITKEENSTLMPMMKSSTNNNNNSPDKLQQMSPTLFDRNNNHELENNQDTPAPLDRLTSDDNNVNGDNNGLAPVQPVGAATFIRIESSSPTTQQQQQQQINVTQQDADGNGQGNVESNLNQKQDFNLLSSEAAAGVSYHHMRGQQPKKHSVADGASIVARSLCSMAGIPSSQLVDLNDNNIYDSDSNEAISGNSDSAASKRKGLRHNKKGGGVYELTANMLAKRNSSASTSGAILAQGALSHAQQAGLAGSARLGATTGGLSAGSRNVSTLELASLAKGLRKGSNMSITSTKSRDVSPTRLKQVVTGLAVKMKRVKLGKSLTHLTLPRMDYGGSSASSTESFVNARGRRPSIAPVPAMMGESEEHDSDHEREQESYFAMSWQSSSESSPILKKFVFCTTYVGVSPTLCYMLQKKKPACCLQLISACEHCRFKNAREYNWPNKCIILASDFASNGIYNFLVPLRAHFHNPSELRPIVLLLERKPSPQFIDAISWFPMVYWMPGSIDNLDDLIKAGINLAHSVVVTNKESTNSAEEDYLADCNTIVAVQTMFKMFPSVGIITELSQSSNMRFMQFRAHDVLFGGLSMANYHNNQQQQQQSQPAHQYNQFCLDLNQSDLLNSNDINNLSGDNNSATGVGVGQASVGGGATPSGSNAIRDRIQLRKLHSHYYSKKMGKQDVNSHAYKYRLPFAAGNVFSASMLDTLLYQAFVKDYMITMVRLLLGIDQAPGSGFLSSMKITKEDLWIRTYGRLYQRLCSTTCEIPLGIYRTEPLETQRHHDSFSFGAFASQQASYEHATEELERIEIINMVKNRLQDLGMLVSDYDDSPANRNNTFSYVIINPNCDIPLREGDIIYLIRPSPIHSRKLFMHRANSVRYTEDSAYTVGNNNNNNNNNNNCKQTATTTNLLNQFVNNSSSSSSSREHKTNKKRLSGQQNNFDNDNNNLFADCPPSKYSVDNKQQQTMTKRQSVCESQQIYLKSCLSDGDFNEILIKVNDPDDQEQQAQNCSPTSQQQLAASCCSAADSQIQSQNKKNNTTGNGIQINNLDDKGQQSRRRSSCSDADDVSNGCSDRGATPI